MVPIEPLISVVTPMFNEAEHLRECIESVRAQTYSNWEYIIVDNCSSDQSHDIALSYQAKDRRIRLIKNQEFLPAIANFNHSLSFISPVSTYCKIVFGDDWIFPECLEKMVEVAEKYPSVGVVGSYSLRGSRVECGGLPYPSTFTSGRELCRRWFLDGLNVFGSSTCLLFRSDLVRQRHPFFEVENVHSDMETCIALLKGCDFGFVHQVLTFSRERSNSLFAMTSSINMATVSNVQGLVNHGAYYLSEAEYKICLDRDLSNYYATLVSGLLRGRGKGFFRYYRNGLFSVGLKFSWLRLCHAALKNAFELLLNPKNTTDKILQILNDRASRRRSGFLNENGKLSELQNKDSRVSDLPRQNGLRT